MTIYGLSQTIGTERLLEVTRAEAGILLTICNHVGDTEPERIVVPADDLMSSVIDRPVGGATIEGTSPTDGAVKLLGIVVRRNEVLLWSRVESQQGRDVAVGLDDFQDGLERVAS